MARRAALHPSSSGQGDGWRRRTFGLAFLASWLLLPAFVTAFIEGLISHQTELAGQEGDEED